MTTAAVTSQWTWTDTLKIAKEVHAYTTQTIGCQPRPQMTAIGPSDWAYEASLAYVLLDNESQPIVAYVTQREAFDALAQGAKHPYVIRGRTLAPGYAIHRSDGIFIGGYPSEEAMLSAMTALSPELKMAA